MEKKKSGRTLKKTEKTVKKKTGEKFILILYVAGITPRSTKAILNIKAICHEHLKDRCEIEIIDIYQQPVLARGDQIIAAPTLIKKLPLPLRKFIGDMSDTKKILVGFDFIPKVDKTGD